MAKIVGLPKLSPTMEEGTLAAWIKKEGESVEIDDLLAEVETDKATMEFRSFDKGVLLKILAHEGDVLEPDTPVAIIGKEGEDISDLLKEVENYSASSKEVKGNGKEDSPSPNSDASADKLQPNRDETKPSSAQDPGRGPGTRILSSPLVRRLAREKGINLADVRGSGPRGRIIKRDIEKHQPSRQPVAGPMSRQAPIVRTASQMRKTIARRLTESKQEVPHYYLTIDPEVSELLKVRKRLNAMLEKESIKVSFNDFVIKACAAALRKVPAVNASWLDGEIHQHQVVDISVAVAIEDGLITPVIRDADRKSLSEISEEVKELAGRAKDKRLQPEEFQNGTFSVSNLGAFGVQEFSAVINPPEGAILAVGAIRETPISIDGKLRSGHRMSCTLSCDHRVIDGAVGAQFLSVLNKMLENPALILA